MSDQNQPEEKETSKFFMASASLEKIDKDLTEFKNLMAYGRIQGNPEVLSFEERQFIGIRLVNQIFIESAPLLISVPKVLTTIQTKINELKPKVVNETKDNLFTGNRILEFNYQLDLDLNACILCITLELAKLGYFMPPKDDEKKSEIED